MFLLNYFTIFDFTKKITYTGVYSLNPDMSQKLSQQTQNICITFVQRRPNVFGVGPTIYKCYTNVVCLLDLFESLLSSLLAS